MHKYNLIYLFKYAFKAHSEFSTREMLRIKLILK